MVGESLLHIDNPVLLAKMAISILTRQSRKLEFYVEMVLNFIFTSQGKFATLQLLLSQSSASSSRLVQLEPFYTLPAREVEQLFSLLVREVGQLFSLPVREVGKLFSLPVRDVGQLFTLPAREVGRFFI